MYTPIKAQSGALIFPTFEPGSELGWTVLAGGPEPANVATGTFAYLVYKNPKWDWRTFDAERDTALADCHRHRQGHQARPVSVPNPAAESC